MRSTAYLALMLLALAACQPQDPEGKPAAAPADAPAANTQAPVEPADPFAGDINALGNEPFWAVKIRKDTITLERPDQPPMVVANPGARRDGDSGVFDSVDPKGRLVVILRPKDCEDGMSGAHYPFAAEVQVAHDYLKGCATHAGAPAPPPTQ